MAGEQRRDFLHLARPDLGTEEIEEILETLRSGWLTTGPRVEALETAIAGYVGAEHVRCLTSCTAGLMLALRLVGVGPGDEVLVPATTFVSCANVVEQAGARPVFVDTVPATGLVDLDHAESLVGPRTRTLMAVHIGGRPADLDALATLGERHGIAILEDAAHAIGARWNGTTIGGSGNLCSFSFHATKNMTTFEGGALVLRDEEEAERAHQLALHGLSRSAWDRHATVMPDRYDVTEPGYKLAMTDVAAAAGIHQLRRLDDGIARREALSALYDELLEPLPLERLAPPAPGTRHARHLYSVLVRPDAPIARDAVIAGLREREIGSSVHFRGVHLYSYYRERYGLRPEELPVATDWSERALTLPLHTGMTEDDVAAVATALAELLCGARAGV